MQSIPVIYAILRSIANRFIYYLSVFNTPAIHVANYLDAFCEKLNWGVLEFSQISQIYGEKGESGIWLFEVINLIFLLKP